MIKQKRLIHFFVLTIAFGIALGGCSLFPKKVQPIPEKIKSQVEKTEKTNKPQATSLENLDNQKNIKKFSTTDEFLSFLEENSYNDNSYGRGFGGGFNNIQTTTSMSREVLKATDSISAPTSSGIGFEYATELGLGTRNSSQDGGSDDFSTTNVQVEGVDEADIIKTDGKYIYSVVKNDVYIIDANPANQSKIISKIAFESRPQDIYINDNSLIVYGTNNLIYTEKYSSILPPRRRSTYTFFKTFDITDKSNPKQVRDLDFEGNYTNSRMIGDYIYFITTKYYHSNFDDNPVPIILENGQVLSTDSTLERCNCPEIYYFDMPYESFNMTSITAINIKDNAQKINSEGYLLSGNQNMHVSQNNIYITYTRYINESVLMMDTATELFLPFLNKKDQTKITQIQATENFILSPMEKLGKIGQYFEKLENILSEVELTKLEKDLETKMKEKYDDISKELEKTIIHKINISKGNLEYQTMGEVTGNVLNQFSMDENNGYFRIATTKNRRWSQFEFEDEDATESYSNLYVLDKNLKQIGQVEKLAPGELIYSVRFMQDRAYMVTFKQTDPLFVIDLKDPKNPRVLGKLKIPGYSNYLHPYNNDMLIGLGQQTKENEWGGVTTEGLKLSLFDVSDTANPKEVDTYIVNDKYSSSIAQYDHKAFLFSRDKNLLVIPLTKKNIPNTSELLRNECGDAIDCMTRADIAFSPAPSKQFRGALVLNVDKNGFKLKGEIDHNDFEQDVSDYRSGYSVYDTSVQRSLYIDEVLYTFSNKYLKMNSLEDLKEVKTLKLKIGKQNEDFEIIKN